MKGKILAFSVVLLLAIVLAAWAAGASETTEPAGDVPTEPLIYQISDSGAGGVPRTDSLFFTEIQKMSGVPIEVKSLVNATWLDLVKVQLASGELTDIMGLVREQADEYGLKGAVVPVDELLKKYPNRYPSLSKMFSVEANPWIYAADGHLYGIPNGPVPYAAFGWVWRQDIADRLNIPTPKTLNDWVAAWRKVKADDPKSIGIITQGYLPVRHFMPLFGLGGADPLQAQNYSIVNGQLFVPEITDRYREMISLFHDLYAEGILWSEYLTASWDDFAAAQASEKAFSTLFYSGTAFNYVSEEIKNSVVAVPAPIGPYGDTGHSWRGPTSNAVYSITNACKYPEAALDFIEAMYTDAGTDLYLYGKKGVTYETDAAGNFDRYTDKVIAEAKAADVAVSTHLSREYNLGLGFVGPLYSIKKTFYRDLKTGSQPIGVLRSTAMAAENLSPYRPPIWNTKEEADRINKLNADIKTFRDEWISKFVNGQTPLSKWDEYIAGMKRMGVEEVQSLAREGYGRFLEAVGKPMGYVPPVEIDTDGMLEAVGLK